MSLCNKRYQILRKNGRYKYSSHFTKHNNIHIHIHTYHLTSQNTTIFIHITDIAYKHIQMSSVGKETVVPVALAFSREPASAEKAKNPRPMSQGSDGLYDAPILTSEEQAIFDKENTEDEAEQEKLKKENRAKSATTLAPPVTAPTPVVAALATVGIATDPVVTTNQQKLDEISERLRLARGTSPVCQSGKRKKTGSSS